MSKYTIEEVQDVSTPRAKRYVAWVILKGCSMNDVRDVIVEATEDVKACADYRNERMRELYGDKPAQVVWLYVANSLIEAQEAKWVARTQWVDDNLECKPLPMDGNDVVEGIIVKWE